ncbi:hypothetical protein E2562_031958 [Oryza meyeriana var. granulata]|uniref:Uncharacterized protein n=1 Tax=Oryza meyeriana var. granulata TaxID=110450 RepID=A0A6G1ERX6_9ORYZ|nr:hypothetical protein E2562_031958 [Oryza meyeriana var. granulata]
MPAASSPLRCSLAKKVIKNDPQTQAPAMSLLSLPLLPCHRLSYKDGSPCQQQGYNNEAPTKLFMAM